MASAALLNTLMLPLFIVSFGLIFALALSKSTIDTAWWRSGILLGFGFLQGVLITPLMLSMADLDPSIPLKAFLLTVVVFACFSLAALLCKDRRFLYMYGMLGSALIGLVVLSVLNMFIQSVFIENVWLYGGLVLFCKSLIMI